MRLPSIETWPWETSWRAWRPVWAKPSRRATVSRRVSSWTISSSPVTPSGAGGPLVVAAHLLLTHPVDVTELLLLHQAGLVLGDALAPPAVLARRIGSLVGRTVRPPAEGFADTPAHLVVRSDLVHADGSVPKALCSDLRRMPPAPASIRPRGDRSIAPSGASLGWRSGTRSARRSSSAEPRRSPLRCPRSSCRGWGCRRGQRPTTRRWRGT